MHNSDLDSNQRREPRANRVVPLPFHFKLILFFLTFSTHSQVFRLCNSRCSTPPHGHLNAPDNMSILFDNFLFYTYVYINVYININTDFLLHAVLVAAVAVVDDDVVVVSCEGEHNATSKASLLANPG